MKLTLFDVVTGKGRSNEGVGNKNYKALFKANKVCRLDDSTSAVDISLYSENNYDARFSTRRPPMATR